MAKTSDLEDLIGYQFTNKNLLNEALTHSSYANEHFIPSNERLEFLGDAVLELASSDYFFHNMPFDEGVLTKSRAKAVCEEALNIYASKIDIMQYVFLGHGEEVSGGRTRPAIIADAFEALLGAVYLDSSFNVAYELCSKLIFPYVNEAFNFKDYKSILQEKLQADKRTIRYEIIDEKGPSNNPLFTAVVYMDDLLMGKGTGKTKQKAEQDAAKSALDKEAKSQDNPKK